MSDGPIPGAGSAPARGVAATFRNQSGQEIGAKGQKTRRRLMAATEALLKTHPIHDLRVADIAARSGTSSASFYSYFADVAEAALAVIDEHTQSTPELLAMIDDSWSRERLRAQSEAFVRLYVSVWGRQAAIFRARNLAADEGDRRFATARETSVRPMLDALAQRVRRNQAKGRLPAHLDPGSTAGVIITLLERAGALVAVGRDSYADIFLEGLIVSAAFVVATLLEGTPPAKAPQQPSQREQT